MTVAELIELLEDYDETAEVIVQDDESGTEYDIGSVEASKRVLIIVGEL